MRKNYFLAACLMICCCQLASAQSAGCTGEWKLSPMQRFELMNQTPWEFVSPPIIDSQFIYAENSTCFLPLDFTTGKPLPNMNGTVFYQGSTAFCRSVDSQVVLQCGPM